MISQHVTASLPMITKNQTLNCLKRIGLIFPGHLCLTHFSLLLQRMKLVLGLRSVGGLVLSGGVY